MKPNACARKWEVEAARDGRLDARGLESALRHRATCAECAREERHLSVLNEGIARLPEVALDAVTARRTRQRLMAALNDSILEPGRPKSRILPAVAGAVACAAALAVWLLRARPHPSAAASPSVLSSLASSVEVRPDGPVQWSEHVDAQIDRVVFVDGSASFTVRPHAGRRVVVQLPDGEAEDLGTVFELRVRAQQTRHVSVTEGRVSLRLRDRPAFILGAGEAWNSDSPSPIAAPAVAPEAPASVVAAAPSTKPAPVRAHAASTPGISASSGAAPPEAPDTAAAKAEDEAYLRIVDALRRDKNTEALSRAKSYLLRFPNGFRRVEVLNIAMRGVDAGVATPSP